MPTYDVYFQPLPADKQNGASAIFTFGFKSAVGISGPQKLINRWLKCLLTSQGSDPYDSSIGTGFADLLNSNIANFEDMRDAVVLFIDDCNKQIFAWDQLYLPPSDERLLSATLVKIEPTADNVGFDAWVQIQNVANDTAVLKLPALATRT
jgi:hypothetical protein